MIQLELECTAAATAFSASPHFSNPSLDSGRALDRRFSVSGATRMAVDRGLHSFPISSRPPKPWSQTLNAVLFAVIFNIGCLMINGTQFVFLLPLRLIPFNWARELYDEGIRYTKGAFAALLREFRCNAS
jgi:hypothetical protein